MTHYQPTKRLFSRAAMTLLMMLLTASTAWAQFSGGDGSENNPYEIASYDDLLTLRNNVNNGERYGNCYFRQTADITWPDGTTWDRGIGYSDTGSHYFRGRYDGNGKKITGFRLATSEQNAGLFGYVLGDYRGTDATNNVIAEVKNVVLVDPVITAQATSGEQYVGTLVGYVSRCVKIDDNTVIGGSVTITGVSNNDNSVYAGGLVGYYYNGDWPSLKRNIVSGTTVSGAGVSGGLVGRLYYSYCVDQNFVDATVSSVQHTGDAGTFYRQGAVVGECYRISNNSNDFTWGYYHNTAGLTFFAKDANGNTKNDQLKTSRIYAVGIVPSDITVSGDGHHSFCGKHYCHGGASITLSGGTNPGYLVSGYTSTDVTITNGAFTMPAKDVTVSATFTPNPVHIEQTATDEYTIHSAEGWGVFCDMLQDNATYNRFIGKTVKLDKDITVTRMAGSDNHDICGTFDGCGHTITLDGNTKTNGCYALFRNAVGATIQNLHVDGTISTAGAYAAGLISGMWGTVKIKNCRISVNILSSQSGECSHGGLVAKNNSGTLEITGCVFDGKLLTTNGSTRCGGFVGWNGGTLTISNSLYAPAELKDGETWVGNDYSSPFACNGATISNCYYTRDFNDGTHYTAQGKAPRTVEAGDYVTVEAVSPVGSPVENGTYNVSGITAYAKGITRGDAFYYGNGDEVSLTLSHAEPPAGYTFTGYTASAGILDGTTLTMPGDGDVTINANYEFIKFTQGALSYECTSGTEVKMTACDKSATSITIPTTVTYDEVTYTVTAIDVNAFADCTSLKCIIMESATPLALASSMVFNSCTALNTIAVPSEAVDAYKAATNWSSYASKILTLDGACGDDVYWSYNSDSKKLTIFGTGAMENYDSNNRPWESCYRDITTIVIRNGVTTIGNKAFYECTALTSIELPASVTSIGYQAFSRCYGLSAFVVDNGNTAYAAEDGVLFSKDKTTLHIYPIGNNRDTYTIPASVTRIASYAFDGCTSLTTVFMQPTTPPTLGNDAFENCDDLDAIYVPAASLDAYKTAWTNYASKIQGYDGICGGNVYYSYDSDSKTLTIFGEGTMEDYSNGNQPWYSLRNDIETVDIRAGVTSIGDYAFSYCTGLSSINIPASVMSIGDWAFNTCDHLTSINIPASVTTIGGDTFGNCIRLSSINIPASVTSIGDAAFLNCYGLEFISVAEGNTVYDSRNGCNALIETASNTLIQSCKNTVIPNTVTSIGDVAFLGCEGLTSITIPASVTSIGDYAFQSCTSLTTVFMESTTPPTLGNDAFENCDELANIYVPAASLDAYKTAWTNYASKIQGYDGTCGDNVYWSYNSTNKTLTIFGTGAMADYNWGNRPWESYYRNITTIVIRNGVTTIGDEAFDGCDAPTNITIPTSVTSIGYKAFRACTALTSITIPASVTTIGESAFCVCTSLSAFVVDNGNTVYTSEDGVLFSKDKTTLFQYPTGNSRTTYTIPASVTTIGDYAFASCTSLTSIDIPASVTTIGEEAFAFCSGLTSINIPASVTSIGYATFAYCTSLTSITIPASVTSIGESAFCVCTSLTNITIPASVTSIGWSAFNGCESLSEVYCLATTPPSLGEDAFYDCDKELSIYVPAASLDDYKGVWAAYASKIQGYDGTCGDNVYWSYNSTNKTLTIFGTGAMADNRPWFSFRTDITTVDIRNGVTTIGKEAFQDCGDLEEIMIPASVASIGDAAFQNCWRLSSIEIPASVTSIGGVAFNGCIALGSITVASGNTIYDSRNDCNALIETASNTLIQGCKYTVIPNTVTSIGDYAFDDCEELEEITIPASVTTIGGDAFAGCTSLTSIEIPASVTTIGDGAFNVCEGLTSITISEGVTSIGQFAFHGCTGLTSITIPASVTSIGHYAFQECTSLATVFMESTTPPTLGYIVFYACDALDAIYVPAGTSGAYKTAWADYASKIEDYGSCGENVNWSYNSTSHKLTIFGTGAMADYSYSNRPWFSFRTNITTVDIRNGVTTIGDYAFYSCEALTNISIPTSVTSIGYYAFLYCTGLESISVASGNTKYDSRNDCNAIIETTSNTLMLGCMNTVIPNTVTTIGNKAFYDCTGLSSIDIPASVTTIGNSAFNGCKALTNISIPTSVTSIGDYAFQDCRGLTSIEIPASVATIGNEAFQNCWGLSSIDIPASVTSIGDAAFNGCTALESITVASGNTIYDSRNDCNALIETASNTLIQGCKNTVIPNTVTSIGNKAFDHCEELEEITIPASVTTIGDYAFADCTSLTSIEIPASVTTIGKDAFNGCKDLTSITIPASVTSIGDYAFLGCTSLTSITIPASVTSIGDYAFQNCTSLTTVFMERTTPPTLGNIIFNACKALDAIYVPTDNVDDYKAAWSDYKDKIKGLDEIIEIALADNASNSDLIAAVNGQTHHVTLQGRTLTKNGEWNTLCLPFSMTAKQIAASPLAGATIKTLDNTVNGTSLSDAGVLTLKFTDATAITAGVPYIIKWTETGDNITNPKFTGVTISSTEPTPVTSTDGKVTFVGQYSPFEIVESGATGNNQGNKNEIIMLSSGNKLGYSKNPRTLHTFRCHFYVPTNDSQQQARSFVLDFGDGETTAITTTDFMDFTDKAGAWYTIDGRKLDKQPAKKGLYIMNGKKVKR